MANVCWGCWGIPLYVNISHEIDVGSAMPAGSVFCSLRGGDDFRHWSSGCIVRGPGIARAGLRLCGGRWDCVGSSGAPALGWCSVGALLSAGFLFWCFIWVPALKCLFWSVFQGLICTFGWCWGGCGAGIGLYFGVVNISLSGNMFFIKEHGEKI